MRKVVPPAVLMLSLLFVYLGSIAPGISWANQGADGGDFITAAATGGIPHPSGYPVYLLLAKFFQLLPIGTLAFRTNLLSALAAVLAVGLVYGILVWLPASPVRGNWLAGMTAGYSMGLAPVFWSQAVITEVYTLHAAFAALIIFLTLWASSDASSLRHDRLRGLALGLAVGNHLTSVLLIPAVLLSEAWRGCWKFAWNSARRISVWLGVGLLAYGILPIRALGNPPVNWGNPLTLRQFAWLVTGELYQRRLFDLSGLSLLERVHAWLVLILQQFELPGLLLALIGLIFFFKRTRLYFMTIFNAVVFSLFAIAYASFDSHLYLIPVFLSFAIWIGLGMGGLFQFANRYGYYIKAAVLVLFAFFFAALAVSRWDQVSAARDDRAEVFGARMMETLPENALVFMDGDKAIFTLWYFHFALGQRADIRLIAADLLNFNWYNNTLRTIYPDVDWADGIQQENAIAFRNKGRPICRIVYQDEEEVLCR